MAIVTRRRSPEIRWYFPIWCHHHGSKMRVTQFDQHNHILIISGSAAYVKIMRYATTEYEGWFVEWEVVQSPQEKVNGRVFFRTEELQSAFGLSDESGEFGKSLIERFGADSAQQGKYIRWKNFLNIPCPGTGHDGDPNVSIHLDDEIKEAVKQLLK